MKFSKHRLSQAPGVLLIDLEKALIYYRPGSEGSGHGSGELSFVSMNTILLNLCSCA